MDVEDETNSYLKYLDDSDAQNTYLLGNNEVGLFSIEPMFTEMEATDWTEEGFSLLLNNSLISEDITEDQNRISETLHLQNIQDKIEEDVPNTNTSTDMDLAKSNEINIQSIIEVQPLNDIQLVENTLEKNSVLYHQGADEMGGTDVPDEDSISLQHKEGTAISLQEMNQNSFIGNKIPFDQLPRYNSILQLKPNEKLILVNKNNPQNGNSLLKSSNITSLQKKNLLDQKNRIENDLFSTTIANKCKVCGFLCESLELIKSHINKEHSEFLLINKGTSVLINNVKKETVTDEDNKQITVFMCSECHSICTDKNDLKLHMIKVHNLSTEPPKSVTPNIVNEEKNEKTAVYKKTSVLSDIHIGMVKKQEKSAQKVKCKLVGCTASFPTEDLCNSHEKLHINEKKSIFKCPECDEKFSMWRIARSHMYKNHKIDFGMIVCPMCKFFKSYRVARVLKHMVIHSDLKPFECLECGKSFKQLAQLKNHEIVHKTPEDIPTWCKVKKCDECQRFFANSKSLKCHIQSVHENLKPFLCNICGHKTSRKFLLELHTRQHTGDKPHKCDYCNFRTADHNSLRKHMMKHTGAVTYQCPYCPYKCIQAGSFKNHLLNKHKGKDGTYSCKYCPFSTISQPILLSHEKKHEEAVPKEGKSNTDITNKEDQTELQLTTFELNPDEDLQSCFLSTESHMEDTVDNGDIIIPAGLEQLVS